jgi:hypothetical protein
MRRHHIVVSKVLGTNPRMSSLTTGVVMLLAIVLS